MEEKTPQFNGIFNDYFRKALREFRESRGLTYQELALRLHCNWSTICNGKQEKPQNARG